MKVERLRALRTASQRLDRPRHGSVGELVRALGGVQAQVLSSAELALRARAEGLTREAVTAAREGDHSIVWCWAMRGTLHLVAAEDVAWMLPLFAAKAWTGSKRRLKQLGVRDDHVDLAVEQIERELRAGGPLPRRELAARLAKQGIETRGQAIAHLVSVAAMRGRICFGPVQGRDQTFAALADWIPGFRLREPDAPELARRFLRAYGPATPADLAAWSGLGLTAAREAFAAISAELQEPLEGLWSLGKLREAEPGAVRLLPSFDTYLLGYEDRSFALDPAQARKVNDGGGWIHPQLFVDGEVVGTWTLKGELQPFRPLPASTRKALEEDLADVQAFAQRRSPSSASASAAACRAPTARGPARVRRRHT